MNKKMKRRKKLNNKGMSLVEILVAIVLLSVALMPLMHSFLQVTHFSMKGRELQQTTAVAQTVMENFKAYDIKGIAKKFDDNNFLTGDYASECLYQRNNNYSKFTVDKIKVDNSYYGAQVLVSEVTEAKETVLDFMDMNDKLDAVFVADTSLTTDSKTLAQFEESAFEEIFQGILAQVAIDTQNAGERVDLSVDDVYDEFYVNGGANNGKMIVDRTIYITTEGTDGSNNEKVTVKYEYKFKPYNNEPFKTNISTGTVSTVWTAQTKSAEFVIYTNADSHANNARLERVYFFYYPGYEQAGYTDWPCDSDKIVITNGSGTKDIPVYMVKMKNTYGDSSIGYAENTYKPTIVISNGGRVKLSSNLKENLGQPSAAPAWSESANLVDNYGRLIEDVSTKTFDLVQTKEEVLMYNITINVFKNANFDTNMEPAAGSEKVLTLDGSKLNW